MINSNNTCHDNIVGSSKPCAAINFYEYFETIFIDVQKECDICDDTIGERTMLLEQPSSGIYRGRGFPITVCGPECAKAMDDRSICPICGDHTYHVAYESFSTNCTKCDPDAYKEYFLFEIINKQFNTDDIYNADDVVDYDTNQ